MHQLLEYANQFQKLAQTAAQDPSAAFQAFLYDHKLFYMDQKGGPSKWFADKIWTPLLEKAEVYDNYQISLIIPQNTLTAKFTGEPAKLVDFLNKYLAPKISQILQSNKGKQIRRSEFKVEPPAQNVIIQYMST